MTRGKSFGRRAEWSFEGKKEPGMMSLMNMKDRYLGESMDFEYTVDHMDVFLAPIFWVIYIPENAVSKSKTELSPKVILHCDPNNFIWGVFLTVCDLQRNTPSPSQKRTPKRPWQNHFSVCRGGEGKSSYRGRSSRFVPLSSLEQWCSQAGLSCVPRVTERSLFLTKR